MSSHEEPNQYFGQSPENRMQGEQYPTNEPVPSQTDWQNWSHAPTQPLPPLEPPLQPQQSYGQMQPPQAARQPNYNYAPEPDEHQRPQRPFWSAERVERIGQIISVLLGALDTLLVIRFALKLLGANPDAAFTSFIYGVTDVFVAPFEGVFPSPQSHNSVLELSTLLAIVVYALVAWLIVSLLEAFVTRHRRTVF